MHIIFISCCEKKSLKRTRTVLDSYARRSGAYTWLTPITQEGLEEIRKALRKTATRQTAVACFRNDGKKRMRLLWVVGNHRYFNKQGISPVATTAKKASYDMPPWAKLCAVLAETAGFLHDIGKFNKEFQDKLRAVQKNTKDSVRHEWLSMFLTKDLLKGIEWPKAAKQLESIPNFSEPRTTKETLVFTKHLTGIFDALLFCIATHHKLPKGENGCINDGEHVNRDKKTKFKSPFISFTPDKPLFKKIQDALERLKKREETFNNQSPVFWRAIATFSRMALILADQTISAKQDTPDQPILTDDLKAYANTNKMGGLNQELCSHLIRVGHEANDMVFRMLNISLPSLSLETVEKIQQPAKKEAFRWQNRSTLVLENSCREKNTPHLVLNMAGTGSGKTRMNLRAICALSNDKPPRIAVALNLRTLTLQTSDAYREMGIGRDEMACVIGDLLTQKLHESGSENVDEDKEDEEYGLEFNSDFEFSAPPWLEFYTRKQPKLNNIIGAPLLVSTIDFLIAAGEPHRKHHHILAALRIMHSDLILDEIDSYEPKALISVLRLVMMAALFGRHVVASSATLSKPVAEMLWKAYAHGAQMRALLYQQPLCFKSVLIDDLITPQVSTHTSEETQVFMADYERHIEKMMGKLAGKNYRIPVLAKIAPKNEDAWMKAIADWAETLHRDHGWQHPEVNKKLSMGLIRIANIKTAIKVARHLSKIMPKARVVCYHANHFLLQRFHIEKKLDHLLNRKTHPYHSIIHDPDIQKIIKNIEIDDIPFIVVATPVEEIGRDHDFDWAIIEPSSAQSIVQTAGRVNRHRRVSVQKPNVALLQFCYKEVIPAKKSNYGENHVFTKPGLERTRQGIESTHLSHDLKELFDWQDLSEINAKMRFCSDRHKFAHYDDEAIKLESESILKTLLTEDHLWMAKQTYTKFSLRDLDKNSVKLLMHTEDLNFGQEYAENYQAFIENSYHEGGEKVKITCDQSTRLDNVWLMMTDQELLAYARQMNAGQLGLGVRINFFSGENLAASIEDKIGRDLSFGFHICTSGEL